MFTWMDSQTVKSDLGFEVSRAGRFAVEYREGNRVMTVEIDNGLVGDKPCVMVDTEAFKRWDGDPIQFVLPANNQKEILRNFIEAHEFKGLAVLVAR